MHDSAGTAGRIGRFDAADLHKAAPFAAFGAAVRDPDGPDCAFYHAPDRFADVIPAGLVRGSTVFGTGISTNHAMRADPRHRLKGLASVALRDAVLAPASMAIFSPARGFFAPSVDNLAIWGGRLSAADPAFAETADGGWRFADPGAEIPFIDAIALPVCGIGAVNYGHFFYDGLAAALLHRSLIGLELVLAGRALLPWQAEILDGLGLRSSYVTLDRPTRFRKILTSDMVSWTVQYPNRFVRTLFDRLRFRFGPAEGAAGRIMIRRGGRENHRVMRNRDEIEAIASGFGFVILDPATLPVADQARRFAAADCVIGESGAALANLGFCDPGTRVIEIQPDRFPDGWTRAASYLLGLRWHVFFAPVDEMLPDRLGRSFRFTVDPDEFRLALATVFGLP